MSRPVLVIGNKNYSSWSLRAWLVARKAGLELDEVRVPLDVPGYKETLLRHSPTGKVPALRVGELVVWDSLAIAEHLAESHPSLWPSDPAQRARARSVSAEMHSGFHALREAMPMNCRAEGRRVEAGEAVQADIRRISALWVECLAGASGGDGWLFGDFTIADAMYAPVASRFRTYGVELSAALAGYVERVLGDALVQDWYEAARREREVIEREEVG